MKDLIIIIGTMVLGVMIFNMILGDEGSLRQAGTRMMDDRIQYYGELYR